MRRRSRHAGTVIALALTLALILGAAAWLFGGHGTTATPTTRSCGSVSTENTRDVPTDAASATVAERCFATAFGGCERASLVFEENGVDTGSRTNLTVERDQSGCVVRTTTNTHALGRSRASTSDTCTSAAFEAVDLIVRCPDGDLAFPLVYSWATAPGCLTEQLPADPQSWRSQAGDALTAFLASPYASRSGVDGRLPADGWEPFADGDDVGGYRNGLVFVRLTGEPYPSDPEYGYGFVASAVTSCVAG